MVDLSLKIPEIKEFLETSIHRFQLENQMPNSIGIYSCPRAGWITTNFNIKRSLSDTENNCPDFEFVEFDFFELPEWEEEYEKDAPEFKLNNEIKYHDHDLGDEHFNELIFNFLKPIAIELKENYKTALLLQMLDSALSEEI